MSSTLQLALPDCELKEAFRLTPAQREALARALLAHGPQEGLRAFLAQHEQEANLAQSQAEFLGRLEESGERAAIELEHQEGLADLARDFQRRARTLQEEQALLQAELERFDPLAGALTQSQLLHRLVEPPRLKWWQRWLAWWGRLWRRFIGWLRRLLGRSRREAGKRRKRLPTSLVLGGRTVLVEAALEEALQDPELTLWMGRESEGELAPGRMRSWWRRNFRPAKYKEAAEAALKRELDRVKSEAGRRKRHQRERLKELAKEEASLEGSQHQQEVVLERHHDRRLEEQQALLKAQARTALQESVARQALIAGLVEAASPAQRDGLRGRPLEVADLLVSESLIASLGSRLFDELMGELTVPGPLTGISSEDTGTYQRRPLMSQYEISRLDFVASLVNARLAHPNYRHLLDSDLVVHAEERLAAVHAVICLDISGSMEENQRLAAAKRAALALYGAVKADRQANRVDFVALGTTARQVGLRQLWELEARGFTNTAAAVTLGHLLLEEGRADRRLFYLITDGLPEAFTTSSGEPRAGDLERAMEQARRSLEGVARLPRTKVGLLLLEPEEELFVSAAQELAAAGRGRLLVTDPQRLAKDLVVDFLESTLAPAGTEAPAG